MSLKQTRSKFGIEQPEGDVLHNADEILKTATITWVTSLVLDTLRTCKDKIKLRGLLAKDLERLGKKATRQELKPALLAAKMDAVLAFR